MSDTDYNAIYDAVVDALENGMTVDEVLDIVKLVESNA